MHITEKPPQISQLASLIGRNGKTAQPQTPATDPPLAALADAGDVLGLLDRIRSKSVLDMPPDAMEFLTRAIRRKEKDLPGLIETAFAEIIGFATMLLVRCQMHVEVRLADASANGASQTHMPVDLDKDGWLARIERIARFLTEISSAKARIEHVTHLNNESKRKHQKRTGSNSTRSVGDDPRQDGAGEAPPHNGRGCFAESTIQFP